MRVLPTFESVPSGADPTIMARRFTTIRTRRWRSWTLDDKNNLANFSPNSFQSKYPNPYFNLNDIGGSVGGPIPLLKKTWFFAAYERDYAVAPTKIASGTIPHPSLYTGDFSALNDSAKPVVPAGVTLTPEEMASNTIVFTDGTRRFVT